MITKAPRGSILVGVIALALLTAAVSVHTSDAMHEQGKVEQTATVPESERELPAERTMEPREKYGGRLERRAVLSAVDTTALTRDTDRAAGLIESAERRNDPAAAAVGTDDPDALLERAQREAALSSKDRARLVRLPVISAIRGEHPNGEARYHAMRDALAESGTSNEPWTVAAKRVFESWNTALPGAEARRVDLSSVACFRAGCEVGVTFVDRAAYDSAAREFRAIRESREHAHGGRVQTPAVESGGGRVEAAWMMLRPDGMDP
jgi:hypothetical protein